MLIGRSRELELVREFLASTAAAGARLLLAGDAGLGKTALLDEAAESAAATGMRVLRAGGIEFEADLPFSGLSQVLLPLTGDLDTLAGQYSDVLATALGLRPGSAPGRFIVCNAVLGMLRRASEAGPLVLVIDDLQWLDQPSAEVLRFVGQRLAGSRIGLLVAALPDGSVTLERAGWPLHELAPLDHAVAVELLYSRFPTLAAGVRRRLLAEAAGNPLALLELPATLSEQQRQALRALPSVLPLSHRLEVVDASRIAALPPPPGTCCYSPCWQAPANSASCRPQRTTRNFGTCARPSGMSSSASTSAAASWSSAIRLSGRRCWSPQTALSSASRTLSWPGSWPRIPTVAPGT